MRSSNRSGKPTTIIRVLERDVTVEVVGDQEAVTVEERS